MNEMVGFGILGVVSVFGLVILLRVKNNYRRYVSQADQLIKSSFEKRQYAGGEVQYFFNGIKLSFLETFFAERDISSLSKKGVELTHEYCSGRGRVIEDSPEFKKLLSNYEDSVFKQWMRFGRMYHNVGPVRAPYSYRRWSYVHAVSVSRVSAARVGTLAL